MKKSTMQLGMLALLGASILISAWTTPAGAWDRGKAELFAVLPEGATGPEGIAVGRDGKVYVTTFGFNATGPVNGPGQLYVFNDDGRLIRQVSIAASTSHLLGMGFHPSTHALLVIDFGAAKVLSVDPTNGNSFTFMTVPTPPASTGLNALTLTVWETCTCRTPFRASFGKLAPLAVLRPPGSPIPS